MVRGTFANIRLKNQMVPGVEGGVTVHLPSEEQMSIFDAAMRYQDEGTPLVVIAGKEYGTGSSRDWAAKGTLLLGVRAVIAESYERIHRSNLVGMGVLPLQFLPGESVETLGLTGREEFDVLGVQPAIGSGGQEPGRVRIIAGGTPGGTGAFQAIVRIDTPQEAEYYRHGGILQYVLRRLLAGRERSRVGPRGAARPIAPSPPSPLPGRDALVDEGSVESFPASDPPAY
jgi:aconitate hydratase